MQRILMSNCKWLSRLLSRELSAKSTCVTFLTTFKEVVKVGNRPLPDTIKTQRLLVV